MGVSADDAVPGRRVGEERDAGVDGPAAASAAWPEAIRWLVRIIAGTGMVVVHDGNDCSDPVLCKSPCLRPQLRPWHQCQHCGLGLARLTRPDSHWRDRC